MATGTEGLRLDKKYQYSKPYPKEAVDALDAILALPSGAERWRKIAAVWINLNQMQESGLTSKEEYYYTAKSLQEKRESLADKFAEWKSTETARDSGIREGLELPAGLMAFLKLFDATTFNQMTKKDLGRVRQAFPEFVVAEKY